MKIRLAVALVRLAFGFTMPLFAQTKRNKSDPKMLEGLLALGKDFDDAFNNNDAAAFAALFTKDAVLVTNTGSVYGPDAIVKYQAEGFKSGHFSNL